MNVVLIPLALLPLFLQATLSGDLKGTNVLEVPTSEYIAVSIARTGSPLILVKADGQTHVSCQDIVPAPPALPPPRVAIPPLQSWFPLESYQYCGAWQYEGFSSGNIQLADMAINQFTR